MVYSFTQLYNALLGPGIPSSDAQTLAGIGIAESSGNPSAINYNTNGSTDYGLWQVNSAAWPQLNPSSLQGADINTQAAAAAQVYQNQGLTAWSTYNSGAYQKYVQPVPSSSSNALGSSLTINPNADAELEFDTPSQIGDTGADAPSLTDSDFAGLTDADIVGNTTTPLGQGGIGSDAVAGGTTGTQFDTAGGQPVTITDVSATGQIAGTAVQKGLGQAGTDVQQSAAGITGTIVSAITSLETYTSEVFVVVAIVAVGAILIAYGLGLFKHSIPIPV